MHWIRYQVFNGLGFVIATAAALIAGFVVGAFARWEYAVGAAALVGAFAGIRARAEMTD